MADPVINGLNDLLADATVFRFKSQQRHWNVRGRHFFELHAKFEELYNRWTGVIDEIAERLLALGATPLKTTDEIKSRSTIREAPGEGDEAAMVQGTLADLRAMRERMLAVIDLAVEANDKTTENLLDPHIDFMAKANWMFAAFLGQSV
jgi:starvation-inducible DNA-binding protein